MARYDIENDRLISLMKSLQKCQECNDIHIVLFDMNTICTSTIRNNGTITIRRVLVIQFPNAM